MDELLSAISTVGFPIAVCVYLLWKSDKDNQRHDSEIKTITDSLNNNTLALQHLADKLEK